MTAELIQRVRDRMHQVLDPCSCNTGSPVDIVDLGLVESIDVSGSTVDVTLVPTTPMCTYMTQIIEDVQNTVGEMDAVDEVTVTQDLETMWTPDRMEDELHAEWQATRSTVDRPDSPAESG